MIIISLAKRLNSTFDDLAEIQPLGRSPIYSPQLAPPPPSVPAPKIPPLPLSQASQTPLSIYNQV